ncbi:MAG: hotdog domain-containing protein [Lachnospiraceae bacterium]|nr:hotdog domain-containing protein [Lachnospiraceae bacterium]
MEQERAKRVKESLTEQAYEVRARYTNAAGRLFGGNLMSWINETASIVGRRHANTTVVTVAVDSLQFTKPVLPGQTAVLVGRVTHVGNSSMEIRVDTFVEDLNGRRQQVNRAYMVLVSMKDGITSHVPRLILETEEEKQEWEAGEKRDELRRQRRKEGF